MIQDIGNHHFDNQSFEKEISDQDIVFLFKGNQVILKKGKDIFRRNDVKETGQFCFVLDDVNVYAKKWDDEEGEAVSIFFFRNYKEPHLGFAAICAYHLYQWYDTNKYCGRCGHKMVHSKVERALICSECKNTVYPRINPVVIVAIYSGDKICLTHYASAETKNYALVAGFVEFGEMLEDAIIREVKEEVGLKIKNIEYITSQPWGFSQSIVIGFKAELDGDDQLTVEEDELQDASWVSRDEIGEREFYDSMTSIMIKMFKDGEF